MKAGLTSYLGRTVEFRGAPHLLKDVLLDQQLLILEPLAQQSVQTNAYGEGHRRVPSVIELPLASEEARLLIQELASQ